MEGSHEVEEGSTHPKAETSVAEVEEFGAPDGGGVEDKVLEESAHGLHTRGDRPGGEALGLQPELVIADGLSADVAHVGDADDGQPPEEDQQPITTARHGGHREVKHPEQFEELKAQ